MWQPWWDIKQSCLRNSKRFSASCGKNELYNSEQCSEHVAHIHCYSGCLGGPKGRIGVESPVAPSRSRQTILKEHTDDRHHRQPPIGKFGSKLALFGFRVIYFANEVRETNSIVAWRAIHRGILHEPNG